jgi:hypothetical protein
MKTIFNIATENGITVVLGTAARSYGIRIPKEFVDFGSQKGGAQ